MSTAWKIQLAVKVGDQIPEKKGLPGWTRQDLVIYEGGVPVISTPPIHWGRTRGRQDRRLDHPPLSGRHGHWLEHMGLGRLGYVNRSWLGDPGGGWDRPENYNVRFTAGGVAGAQRRPRGAENFVHRPGQVGSIPDKQVGF